MSNNFFITGIPKSGKTTLLHDLVKELKNRGLKVGGFLSPEVKEHGTREGFYIQDIETGNRAMLACVGCDGPKVAKYNVEVKDFEGIALQSMKNAGKYDVIVIDEIGVMEMKSTAFQDALTDLIESEKHLVASLHRDYVNMYEIFGRVYELDETNRGSVYSSLLRNIPTAWKTQKSVTKKQVAVVATKKVETPMKKEKTKKVEKKIEPTSKLERKEPEKKPQKAKIKKLPQQAQKKVEAKKSVVHKKMKTPPKQETKKQKGGLLNSIKKILGI